MASCIVPDFPAVMVALEHLKELDQQLKEDEVPFSPEASLQLTEITAAITEVDADRRTVHEHLEVETIENGKLRYNIHYLRERIMQDIMAEVARTRTANAEEIEKLHKCLNEVSELQESTVKRRETLLIQNEALLPEREKVQAEHKEIVALQNEQITRKYDLQRVLAETKDRLEALKSCIAAAKQDIVTLQQNMLLEREAYMAKKNEISREVDQAKDKIQQQKQSVLKSRGKLERLNVKKRETHDHLEKLMMDMVKLESNLQRLAVSRCQCEKVLQDETVKHQEWRQQRATLKKELHELKEAFCVTVQILKKKIATVEDKIENGRALRLVCQDSLAQIFEVFQFRRIEENEVGAEHFRVSQDLEQTTLQLEKRIGLLVKYSKEIKEMDKQIKELLEAEMVMKRVSERNRRDLANTIDTEKTNISHFEEEKRRLKTLLEEGKRTQEEHVAKMSLDISNTRMRYQELQQEEIALQKRQPKSTNVDLFMSYVTECEVEYKLKETKEQEEIERCRARTMTIMRSCEEKQRELEEQEEMLKKVVGKWDEEKTRHQRLNTLTSELRKRRSDLRLAIEEMKEKTVSLLKPKEEKKAELKELRESYIDMLDKQASERRAVEMSIYDNGVKLEQVGLENSRLHLRVRQLTEDINEARKDKERYWQEVHRVKRDIKTLFESLQNAWKEDSLVTRDGQNSDRVVLVSLSALLNHLEARRKEFGNVSTLLHHQMLDFSKRLGDKMTIEQQS